MGGSLGAKIFVFFVCVCPLFRRGWSEVLIKYTGKYVKIYFIIKITFSCALLENNEFVYTYHSISHSQLCNVMLCQKKKKSWLFFSFKKFYSGS